MKSWAQSQGFTLVREVTDDSRPVDAKWIKDEIKIIVDGGDIDQLVVYFGGHGVNIGYGEYWLLTGAPSDTNEAVNVRGSVALAQRCSIPHVVLISDACRTAAQTIRAQALAGSDIFPNQDAGGTDRSVDTFRACALGEPALEVPDLKASVEGYTALYTDVLVKALNGVPAELVERAGGDATTGYVRPWPLKKYLMDAVGREMARRLGVLRYSQTPDATITSDQRSAWLSRLPLGPKPRVPAEPRGEGPDGGQEQRPPPPPPPGASLLSASEAALRGILGEEFRAETDARPSVRNLVLDPFVAAGQTVPEARLVTESISQELEPIGPPHFETRCGFKVRGASIVKAFCPDPRVEVKRLTDALLRIEGLTAPAANVLLVTDSGTGTVVPAIGEFLASLTFDQNQLVSVAYEPADTSNRWYEFRQRADELRALRSLIAVSARHGVFRLEGDDPAALARRMQIAKGVDPAMALYAAYAYDELGRQDRLREMEQYLREDLRIQFFDVALLARRVDGSRAGSMEMVFPFFPMLAQGWSLLSAHRIGLPPAMQSLRSYLLPSLWTLFDPPGVEVLQVGMRSGDLR